MKQVVFYLKDSEISDWLINEFDRRKFDIVFLGINNLPHILNNNRFIRILKLHFSFIKLALKFLNKSKHEDIAVCVLDVLALYVFIFCKLTNKRRKIIAINIMLNDNNDFITRLKKYLFSLMLNDDNVFPTVTSKDLKLHYTRAFKLSKKEFYLLHDCYGKLGKYKKSYEEGAKYIFCGGTNGRDWGTLLNAAKLLSNIKFVIVGPQKDTLGEKYPSNIEYYYDISFHKFQELIENCSLLALPLNTQAPAGLIVLFTAGLMSKPVITTDNATTREYITNEENGILIKLGDYLDLAKQINLLYSNEQKQKIYGQNLFNRIETMGSPQVFVDKIINLIHKIVNESSSNK